MSDNLTSPFAAADLERVRGTLDGIGVSADKVARSLSGAFAGAIVSGQSFEKTLQKVALGLSKLVLNSALQPVTKGLTSLAGALFSGGASGEQAVAVTPFAEGGIVSRPTFFGAGGGVGLMGERGAEAILPLARGPDGRLGLATRGGEGRAPQIHVRIAAADPESFRHSQVQIAGALARAVARGQRGL